MNDDCIFCNPDPDAIVYRGEDGIILLDYPCRPGHVLVGVVGHYPNLHEVPSDQIAAMMKLALKTSQLLVSKLGAEKTYVVAIGDKDKHFHVHLIPKMSSDPSLGPNVFSDKGWATFLPQEINSNELKEIKKFLGSTLQ